MKKLHIKKGDTVYVNAGNDKGKTGKVLAAGRSAVTPLWQRASGDAAAPRQRRGLY